MIDVEETDDGQPVLTGARFGSVPAIRAVVWSVLVAFMLFAASGTTGSTGNSAGRTSGISGAERIHFLSLASRDGSRQTLSADRKSAPHSRLDPPVALEALTRTVRRDDARGSTVRYFSGCVYAYHPAGYDCRGPPSSTT